MKRIMRRIETIAVIVAVMMFGVLPVKAQPEGDADSVPSTGGAYIQTIREQTETSVVYDCGMYPAKKLDISRLTHNNPQNNYKDFKTPAMVTKIRDDFFVVDTYHNQVLYSRSLQTPVEKWNVLGGGLDLPHGIASDGKVYLVTDTERYQVDVYEWIGGRYQNTQVLENIGIRPHHIRYDESEDSFFVWSAHTGEMYILKKDSLSGVLCIDQIRQIKELYGQYVRSFTILGDTIWFPSGSNGYITVVDKNTFEVKQRYPVADEIAGMAFIQPIGDCFYMTVSTDRSFDQSKATFIRTNNLTGLANGEYEDIYDAIGHQGVPYYMEQIGASFYVTTHGSDKSLWRLEFTVDGLVRGRAIY